MIHFDSGTLCTTAAEEIAKHNIMYRKREYVL